MILQLLKTSKDINEITPATAFYNQESLTLISFNQTSGDLITGDKQPTYLKTNYKK